MCTYIVLKFRRCRFQKIYSKKENCIISCAGRRNEQFRNDTWHIHINSCVKSQQSRWAPVSRSRTVGKVSIDSVVPSTHLAVLPTTNGEMHWRCCQRIFLHLVMSVTPAFGDTRQPTSAALCRTLVKIQCVCRSGQLGDPQN